MKPQISEIQEVVPSKIETAIEKIAKSANNAIRRKKSAR